MRNEILLVILSLYGSSALGQSSSNLEMRYGKPVITYQVSENIWMTPEYSADGEICRMRLHPRRFSEKANYLSPTLPFQELTAVLNELVPLKSRGAKKDPFNNGAAGGGADWMTYAYENVTFTFVSSFDPPPDSWKHRETFVFTVEPSTTELKTTITEPSEDDFSPSRITRPQIVTIKWNGRQCVRR